jgi:uncharacterized protein GlcG (DUF336 family)
MSALTLEAAHKIIEAGLAYSREAKFNPMGIVVLDARGALKAASLEDNTSLIRWRIAYAKAYGALGMGSGTRKLAAMAAERPAFIGAATQLAEMGLVPVAGGVLIKTASGEIIGAVGVSGDTSDNDEIVGVKGIEAAGLTADGG